MSEPVSHDPRQKLDVPEPALEMKAGSASDGPDRIEFWASLLGRLLAIVFAVLMLAQFGQHFLS
jgi:hypothetical protein